MLRLRPKNPNISAYSPIYLTVTWFQSGRIRPASGSWGTLAGFISCWLIRSLTGFNGLLIFAILVGALGWLAVKHYARTTENPDPSEVVVDEVLGMAIVGLCIPFTFGFWVTGFVFFRLFDSIKRGPVGWCDKKIKGPFGIMFDDVVAAFLASAVCFILYLLVTPTGHAAIAALLKV